MLSILCVRLTVKVKVGIPESFKVGWYPLKKTGSSHLNSRNLSLDCLLIQYGCNIVDFCIHLPGVLTSPAKNISNPLLSGSNIPSE